MSKNDRDLVYVPPPGGEVQYQHEQARFRQRTLTPTDLPHADAHLDARALDEEVQLQWLLQTLDQAPATPSPNPSAWPAGAGYPRTPTPSRRPGPTELEPDDDHDDDDAEIEPIPQRRSVSRRPRRRNTPTTIDTDTAFIDPEAISAIMRILTRLTAFAVLAAGAVGNIGAFLPNGVLTLWDLRANLYQLDQRLIISGICGQIYLTVMQWWLAPRDFWERLFQCDLHVLAEHKVYTGHLAADVGLTTMGYHVIMVPLVTQLLTTASPDYLPEHGWWVKLFSWLISLIVFVWAAAWPEQRLVKRRM